MKTLLIHLFLIHFLLTSHSASANEYIWLSFSMTRDTINVISVAKEYISTHLDDWNLSPSDIADMRISDMYTDQSSGITRIYFQQHYEGIPVNNAILNLNITKDGIVFFATNRFVRDLYKKINTTKAEIHPLEAIANLATHLALAPVPLRLKVWESDSLVVFEKNDFAREDITAALVYQPANDNVFLSWDIFLAPLSTHDSWSARVDAMTGKVIKVDNWTLYCHVDGGSYYHVEDACEDHSHFEDEEILPLLPDDPVSPTYNVWPAPYESPDHGPRTLVTNPADTIASPYGWHDTNGQPGHEYTITRGNNCFSYQDRDNTGYSSQDEPDGGPDLHFDFPFDPSWEPEQYMDASVVNLFYWTNYLHDFSYRFGFDEAAGNFQKNNYGRGGQGNDFLWAVAQAAANTDTLHNNAEYHHNNEGRSASIFMYDYIELDRCLTISEPVSVGGIYRTNLAGDGWGAGAYVSDIPVSGEVVLVNDGVEDPLTSDACQEIINASELAGKIALIDRGGCHFSYKAWQAQQAGAIGVIFCNTLNNEIFTLGAGPDAPNVNIPVVLITLTDSETLRKMAGQGLNATFVIPDQSGPARLTSDFDAGLIAHEYGHGISLRLAGGPDKTCLDNAEQMGEGWSDYFSLVTTVQPGDTGEKRRGIGTYATNVPQMTNGIRRYPYSTDMSVSPLTYGDVAPAQEKHDLGEVWAAMLWDMYWALSDQHGWSADPYDPSSGNYKAVRLVMDGLKNMACDPGFVDGRDAILAADVALNNGENQCLLWEVFARRGLGYSADQGSPYDAGDQVEAFDLPPGCTGKINIEKSVSPFIQAGEDIQVTINVGNY
ncbi:MAG TPA: M36 family metallopeptidase, partial [Saprospiraceae bacterium]